MTGLRLDQDYQVHSTFSDDAKSSLFENIRAAESAGLRTMCLVDHARASTAWVPDMVDAVDDLRPRAGLSLLVGVEVKMLDRTGLLDSPEPVVGVDHILIADHQYRLRMARSSPRTCAGCWRRGRSFRRRLPNASWRQR